MYRLMNSKNNVAMKRCLLLLGILLVNISSLLAQKDLVISGGNSVSSFVCENKTAYVWGSNAGGQLGLTPNPGAIVSSPMAVVFPGTPEVKQINSGSGSHFVALTCTGDVWSWGTNADGQVGNGTTGGIITAPTRVLANTAINAANRSASNELINASVVYAGTSNSFAILNDKRLVSWGKNDNTGGAFCAGCQAGQLGQGTTVTANRANYVLTAAGTPLENVIQVFAGDNVAYALVDDNGDGIGTVYSWGEGNQGTLGRNAAGNGAGPNDGTTIQSSYARPVHYADGTPMNNILELQAGDVFGIALDVNNHVWTWGNGGWNNSTGNTTINATSARPARVIAGFTTGASNDGTYLLAKAIGGGQGFGMAVTVDGKPVAWGGGGPTDGGATGNGTLTGSKTGPQYIQRTGGIIDNNVTLINRGDTWGFYGTSDNKFYAWGANSSGQLGIGNLVDQAYAIQITPPSGCDFRDPAPFVDLNQDDITVCQSDFTTGPGLVLNSNFTILSTIASKYTVTWYRNGTSVKTGPASIASNLSYTATQDGTYKVEIIYTGTGAGCVVYDPAVDEMTIDYFTPSFTVPNNLTFCGNEADVNVNYTGSTDAGYSWYPTSTSNTVLGTTIASGSTTINVSTATVSGANRIVYVEETSGSVGSIISPAQFGTPTDGDNYLNSTVNQDNSFATGFTATEEITITQLSYFAKTNIQEWQGGVSTNVTPATGTVTVTFGIYGSRINNGNLVANNANLIGTLTSVFSRTRGPGDPQELTMIDTVFGNVTLPAGTYFIGIRQVSASTVLQDFKINRRNVALPGGIVDDVNGTIVLQNIGVSGFGNANQASSGLVYNVKFKTAQRFCDRIPVTLTELCPCNQPATVTIPSSSPAYTGTGVNKSITVCTGTGTLATLNGGGVGTAYTAGPGTNSNPYQYSWYKKGTTPVYVNNTTVANKTLTSADAGTWVLRVEDGTAGTASCYREDSVKFIVTAIPAAPTATSPADFCAGTTAPVWSATATGTNTLQWYTAASGGTATATAPAITNTAGVKEIWVSQRTSAATGGCEGPRTALTVTAVAVPAAPAATAPADFCENATAPVWTATATGTNTLQWYNVATLGTASATAPTITNTPAGAKNVWVSQKLASAPGCESPRTPLTLNVLAAPAAPTATAPADFCINTTAPTWSATATGTNTLQWYTAATGGTALTAAPVIPNTPVGAKNVWVSQKLPAAPGCESPRTPITVNVTAATAITSVVANKTTLCVGEALTITATATGTGTLSYVWKRGATTVGTNSNVLSIPTVATTDAGSYTVEVTGTCGTVTSTPAIAITINTPPSITTQPADASGCVGSSSSLVVDATGTPTLTYQWKQGSTNVGTNSATLNFSPLTTASGGSYTVDVTNSCGTVTSTAATVTITTTETPSVSLATDIAQGCGDGATVVTLTASDNGGGSTPNFTFRVNGALIGTANQTSKTATYTLPANNTNLTQDLNFTVDMVSNTVCLASGASLTPSSAPVAFKSDAQTPTANIIQSNQSICVDNITLTSDPLPVGYQGTGTWTTTQGSVANNDGVVTGLTTEGVINVTYTVESELKLCPSKSDAVQITKVGSITDPTPVNAQDQTICISATAPALNGISPLKPGEIATWAPASGTTASISATGQTSGLTVGVNEFEYTISNGTCPNQTGKVTITVDAEPDQPTVSNATITTCSSSESIVASALSPATATGTWSGFTSPVTVTPVNNPSSSVSGLTSGQTVILTWSVINGACTTPKTVSVTVNKLDELTPNVISLNGVATTDGETKVVCLNGTSPVISAPTVAAGEVGTWVLVSGSNTSFSVSGSNPQTITLNSVGQTEIGYEIRKSIGGSCPADLKTIILDVQDVTISAGTLTASSTCVGTPVPTAFTVTPSGAPSGSQYSYQWYLDNVLVPGATNASYTPASTLAAKVNPYPVEVRVTSNAQCVNNNPQIATTTFTVNPKPTVSIQGSGNFCPGFGTNLVALPSGQNYKWTNSSGATVGTNSDTYQANTAGNYTVEVTDGNGCKATASKSAQEINVSATILASPTTKVCKGTSIVLTTQETADQYSWTWNGNPIGTGSSYTATETGVYGVTLTFGTIPGETCFDTDQENLFFYESQPDIIQGDAIICETDPYKLEAIDVNGLAGTFTWFREGTAGPIAQGSSFTVTQTGNYYAIFNNTYCDLPTDTVTVEVDRVPKIKVEPKIQYILEGSSAIISVANSTGAQYYSWSGPSIVGDATIPVIEVRPEGPYAKYLITALSKNQVCEATDSAEVIIELPVKPWNSFSPNGDGLYDGWIIENLETFPNAVVEIYNRWGNLVWQSKGYAKPWFGENFRNGQELPVATYYYIIYPNGGTVKKPLTGNVTIVR